MTILQVWQENREGVIFFSIIVGFIALIIARKFIDSIQASNFKSYLKEGGWHVVSITSKPTLFLRQRLTDESKEVVMQFGSYDNLRAVLVFGKKSFNEFSAGTQIDFSSGTWGFLDSVQWYRLVVRFNIAGSNTALLRVIQQTLHSAGFASQIHQEAHILVVEKNFFLLKSIQSFHSRLMKALEPLLR